MLTQLHKRIIASSMSAVSIALSVFACAGHVQASAETDITDIEGIVGEFTMDEDRFAAVVYDVNKATGDAIDSSIEAIYEENKKEGSTTPVTPRDWGIYSSDLADDGMDSNEQAFYKRLENLSQYYMNDSDIDAYYVRAYNVYAVNGVQYSDLNLSSTDAFYVAEWFLYNNPQYYFLKPTFLTTSSAIYIGCHDFAVDGDKRAGITNEMFDGIDMLSGYLKQSSKDDYSYEKLVHDTVCQSLDYAEGSYDQSLYSAWNGTTVCAGYSAMMSVMLNSQGVDAVTALSACHAWNQVKLNNEWYAADATWDDSTSSYKFFNLGRTGITAYDSKSKKEHLIETPWEPWCPDLSESDYGGEAVNDREIVLQAPVISFEDAGISDSGLQCARIKWEYVPDATGYEVNIYKDETCTDTALRQDVITGSTKGSSMKLSNMKPGKVYYVGVRAFRDDEGGRIYSEFTYAHVCDTDFKSSADDEDVTPIKVEAPESFNADNITESSARLAWSTVNNAEKYELILCSDADHNNIITQGSTGKSSIKITSLEAGVTYYAGVRAVVSQDNNNCYSEWKYCEFMTVPPEAIEIDAPGNLNITDVTQTMAKLHWTGVSGFDNIKYELQLSRDNSFTDIMTSGATRNLKINITGLDPGTAYCARVRAYGEKDGEKYYSDWELIQFSTETEVINAGTVSDIEFGDVSENSFTAVWSVTGDFTGFECELSDDSSFSNITQSVTVTENSAEFSDLSSGTAYYLRIRSYLKSDANTVYSNWVTGSVSTLEEEKTIEAPGNFYAQDVTETTARLFWDACEGAGRYELRLSSDEYFNNIITTGTTGNLKIKLTGLDAGVTYYASVRAEGGEWAVTSFTTLEEIKAPDAPMDMQVTELDGTRVRISWTGTADSYELRLLENGNTTASTTTKNNSIKLTNINPGNTYTVSVRAGVDNNYSDWTDITFTKGEDA